ncbi:YqaE/Pmp3 family membrane protein [Mesoflavibacter profundi]|uniref:YqaE/Pmp3 family membrane protein n=1 Tax=Mesoflavibacter profundi TaxID=2708110 RepID=A0ABT4RZH2_9FLAO|nr:YqaE/Pmp3 family membrane protein [Mesoflavibacter profundi]MDA0177209.1 YqaE/Pmp3 family membrane protein [Mesoflavibacter profundi]
MSILTIILNLFIPPLSVFLNKGLGKDFLINLILSLIFWLPGVIHAFYVTSER